MAPEKLSSKGQAWFCTTGLPSDIVIQVDDMTFHLHKFPLMSRSGKLNKLITEQEQSNQIEQEEEEEEEIISKPHPQISLPSFPGGSQTFEICAKFCYGVKIDITPLNVAPLRCAADYLEMTETYYDGNLVAKTDGFLNQIVLKSLKESIKTLKSCEILIPDAENLNIISKCIDAVAIRAGSDPSLFGWPMNEDTNNNRIGVLWNGIDTGIRRQNPAKSDWFDDVTVLSLPLYKRLIAEMKSRDISSEIIEGSLVCYAKKFIPGISRRHRKLSSSIVNANTVVASESEQRELLETVVENLPQNKGSSSATSRFLFGLLRTANILNVSEGCKAVIEKRIGSQLDKASLDDLLVPSYSYLIETLYDIDCVSRILGYFLDVLEDGREQEEDGFEGEEGGDEQRRLVGSPVINPVMLVGKLIDGYLSEIASDGNLKPEKFYELAAALPEYARLFDDGLYRAIDVYLKAHQWISEADRERICGIMDCRKLTLEACTHAAQNERLPLRAVVQVLFFEQLQLRQAIAGSFLAPDAALPDSGRPSAAILLPKHPPQAGEAWQAAVRDSQVLRLDMDSMRTRVHELERECSTMRREIDKIEKSSPGSDSGGRGGGNGGWSSFTRRFGCKFKSQVCDSHERTVVEARKGRSHERSSSLS